MHTTQDGSGPGRPARSLARPKNSRPLVKWVGLKNILGEQGRHRVTRRVSRVGPPLCLVSHDSYALLIIARISRRLADLCGTGAAAVAASRSRRRPARRPVRYQFVLVPYAAQLSDPYLLFGSASV